MTNEEYLDKLGTAKYLLRDQPVDENTAEFYPPESDEHPKCVELRYFIKGRLNLEFIGLITAKSLLSKYVHTYAWFEMGSSGLQDIVRLWGDNNEDDYPQIKKIIGTGTEKFMVLVEWYKATWDSVETRKDEERKEKMPKDKSNLPVSLIAQYLLDIECNLDNYAFSVVTPKHADIFDSSGWENTHVKPLKPVEMAYSLEDEHYLMCLSGGNNQNGEIHWLSYLANVHYLLIRLREHGYQGWICELKNNVVSDTHTVIMGYRKLEKGN